MAERRMFAKTIIDSDAFLEMPMSARLLYYDLGMRADDDGFVNSPKKIMKICGASNDDMNILILRKFIIPFDKGIVVIKHWKIHNYIRNDRYKPTVYTEEKAMLDLKPNDGYVLKNNNGIPNGYQMDTQDRIGQDSISQYSIDEVNNNEQSLLPASDNNELKKQYEEEFEKYRQSGSFRSLGPQHGIVQWFCGKRRKSFQTGIRICQCRSRRKHNRHNGFRLAEKFWQRIRSLKGQFIPYRYQQCKGK